MLESKGKVSLGEDLSASTGEFGEPEKSLFIAGGALILAQRPLVPCLSKNK